MTRLLWSILYLATIAGLVVWTTRDLPWLHRGALLSVAMTVAGLFWDLGDMIRWRLFG